MTHYCTQCGTVLAPDAAYCTACGQAVSTAPSPAPPKRKGHLGRNIAVGAGAFFGLFILLGLAGAWDPEPQPADATAAPTATQGLPPPTPTATPLHLTPLAQTMSARQYYAIISEASRQDVAAWQSIGLLLQHPLPESASWRQEVAMHAVTLQTQRDLMPILLPSPPPQPLDRVQEEIEGIFVASGSLGDLLADWLVSGQTIMPTKTEEQVLARIAEIDGYVNLYALKMKTISIP